MRLFLLAFYILGLITFGIFIHEGIHWIQYPNLENKTICFFGRSDAFAYLISTEVIQYVSIKDKENIRFKDELQANIAMFAFMFYGMIYLYYNIEIIDDD